MKHDKKHLITCIAVILVFALFATLCYFGPKAEFSNAERRPLAKLPTISVESITSGRFMQQFETYAADTFPLREVFRGLKAGATLATGQKTTNDIYVSQGHLSKLEYPLHEDSLHNAANKFETIYNKLLADGNNKVYVAVIPDKNAYLAQDAGQLSLDYDALEDLVQEEVAHFATYISLMDLLSAKDYYSTDSHWRQEALLPVADALLSTMAATNGAVDPDFTDAFSEVSTQTATNDFLGVYAGQSALPVQSETIYYLTSPIIDQLQVYDHEHQTEIPVYNLEKITEPDPYEVFLSGPISLITIDNPMAIAQGNHRELVVFRDSFGSSIAPLLATQYAKVTLVDIRYLPSTQLGNYVTFEDCDVLFLYSTSVLNNSSTLK